MKQSVLFPCYSSIYNQVEKWSSLSDEEKNQRKETILKELDFITSYIAKNLSDRSNPQLAKLKNFFSGSFDLKLLEEAFFDSNGCNMCMICKNCSKKFIATCATEIFNIDDVSSVIGSDFLKEIKELSLEDKNTFKVINPAIAKLIYDNREGIVNQYVEKINLTKKYSTDDNYFLTLKGMSSSSPWIYNGATNQNYRGGGFFLKWKGQGIAIDPGYNFIDNLHEVGLTVQDIDYVIVTHNHIDHNHDIRIIDDFNKSIWSKKKHYIKWYMDASTYESSKFFLDDTSITRGIACNEIVYHETTSDIKLIELDFCKLNIFPTNHIKLPDSEAFSDDTFGVKIECIEDDKVKIVVSYTSDTHYESSLVDYIEGSDIVIVNISGIYETDIKRIELKKKHLGYWGCIQILENLEKKPELFLLSEFWSGINDIRFLISKYMNEEIRDEFPNIDKDLNHSIVIPADIGLFVSLDSKAVKCSNCNRYSRNFSVLAPKDDFGNIKYICEDCLL